MIFHKIHDVKRMLALDLPDHGRHVVFSWLVGRGAGSTLSDRLLV